MKSYCVKCRKNTENLNSKIFKTKHGRLQPDSNPEPLSSKTNTQPFGLIMQWKCADCGMKNQDLWKNKKQKVYWVKFHC